MLKYLYINLNPLREIFRTKKISHIEKYRKAILKKNIQKFNRKIYISKLLLGCWAN